MVASTFHVQSSDCLPLAAECIAVARLARLDSCRALDDDLALAPEVVVALSLDSRPVDSARGIALCILDIEGLATR